ncbi:restriction endonuclease subunit S [Ruminococcus sp. AM27-11LB]|uniref:restriction endonuclease subunit S n=1 Tax=[Ruminococcus] torques TaxID=33039 RepID=UPI000E536B28|nr:restriction endonuclease subunit S [[Ruminococcus] torques]RGH91470.1 restriction endonuclease subunit S [Ruminococcus sp. AM27-27]RGH93975.1 restriction endonuclease subunit S [Ruminococcus sp. AM27-11LB]
MSKVKLGEIAEIQAGPFGTQLHKNEYVTDGILMLNAKNIGNGEILLDDIDCVSEKVCNRLPMYILQEGDILFGRAGSIERHTYVSDEYAGSFQGTNCIRIRCKSIEEAIYVSYYLWLPQVKKLIENKTGGSVLSYITTDLLKEITIELPDKNTTLSIDRLLYTIDEKRRLNCKINDNLAAMAYDIYMHSFFSKKPNAKLKDILVEADKSSVQVGEAKQSTGEYPFFTSGSAILKWDTPFIDGRNCFLNTGGNADAKFYVGEAAYSTDTWCISANNNMSDYLYLLLVSIKPELNQKFFQGTGLKHLQKPLLKDRPIYIPDFEELKTFNEQVTPMFNIISENTRENQELITLRDWLLPMLMNGQATISD